MSDDDEAIFRDLERHQARALKRLDADAEGAPLTSAYGALLAPPGTYPLADLARSLARDLIAAGFTIHDCAGKAPGGGVCLTTAPGEPEGVIVAWTQHDAAEAALGYDGYRDVQATMNYALADVLGTLGYPVEAFGQAGAHVVTGPRPAAPDDEGGSE